MSMIVTIAGLLIKDLVKHTAGDAAAQAADVLANHWRTHGDKLEKAVHQSAQQAVRAMEVALAGESFWGKLVASGDDRAVRAMIGTALKGLPLELTDAAQMRLAAAEVQKLRKAGVFGGKIDRNGAVQLAVTHTQAGGNLDVRVVRDLVALAGQHGCTSLPRILEAAGQPSLVVQAACYYFRTAVQRDKELANVVLFTGQLQLNQEVTQGFDIMEVLLQQHGRALDELLSQGQRIEGKVDDVRESVLDLRREIERLSSLHLSNEAEVRMLLTTMERMLMRFGMQQGEVKPGNSRSVGSEEDRRTIAALWSEVKALPEEIRRQVPGLLNGMGKLQLGAGDFAAAWTSFQESARVSREKSARAEAFFNAHRAAVEQRRFDDALQAMRQAAKLDGGRFAPFSLRRYPPQKILGAGGFGTVYLCEDSVDFDDEGKPVLVAVKSLHGAELARDIREVFAEAAALKRLKHDAIIGVKYWGFADEQNNARPYIVMDYFPGVSLQDHLDSLGEEEGLSYADYWILARKVVEALRLAHSKNLIHRDIKPANLLVRKVGQDWEAKLIDFGLVLRQEVVRATQPQVRFAGMTTLAKSIGGTEKFSAPEQLGALFDGKGILPGTYSDVYAFAKTSYYMLFHDTEPKNRHWKKLDEPVRSLLEAHFEQCTERHPKRRPVDLQTTWELLEKLNPTRDIKDLQKEGKGKLRTASQRLYDETNGNPSTSQLEPGAGEPFKLILPNNVPMHFAWVPSGHFMMGSESSQARAAEKPVHKVAISKGFYMGICPVTQDQWQAVTKNNPSHFKGENRPVETITWNQADEYCKALGKLVGKPIRLPTEAEWEYACRSGTSTKYYSGDSGADLSRVGWYRGNSGGQTHDVGEKAEASKNNWGLYDMHGNVWEWCADGKRAYEIGEEKDPCGPEQKDMSRVLRGGSWLSDGRHCRAAYRRCHSPDRHCNFIGCRVCFCLD